MAMLKIYQVHAWYVNILKQEVLMKLTLLRQLTNLTTEVSMNEKLIGFTVATILLFLQYGTDVSGEPLLIGENSRQYSCSTFNDHHPEMLRIEAKGDSFDISTMRFQRSAQRPSLNVRVANKPTDAMNEFIDFNGKDLEVIPIGGKDKLEINLTSGSSLVHYRDAEKEIKLECSIASEELISFLGIAPLQFVTFEGTKAVAFDVDDTLMFTSPAFARGFATGGLPKPDDILFWTHTNGCDAGCAETTITLDNGSIKVLPANAPSTPKAKALELIFYHKVLGHKIYAITARPNINGDPLRDYLETQLGIARENIFFEPEINQPGNVAGKTDRIESLNLDVFYGDSDSDITDTMKAFLNKGVHSKIVHAVRFLRSPKSSNREAEKLNKYHPGYFGEPILSGSYE